VFTTRTISPVLDICITSGLTTVNLIAWLTLRVATRYHADHVHNPKPQQSGGGSRTGFEPQTEVSQAGKDRLLYYNSKALYNL
jgi:hypothetical protein